MRVGSDRHTVSFGGGIFGKQIATRFGGLSGNLICAPWVTTVVFGWVDAHDDNDSKMMSAAMPDNILIVSRDMGYLLSAVYFTSLFPHFQLINHLLRHIVLLVELAAFLFIFLESSIVVFHERGALLTVRFLNGARL